MALNIVTVINVSLAGVAFWRCIEGTHTKVACTRKQGRIDDIVIVAG
jgi:hypothetical protein